MNKPEKWIVRFEKHLSVNLIVGLSLVDIFQLDETVCISCELLLLNNIGKLNVSPKFQKYCTITVSYNIFFFLMRCITYNSAH